MYARRLISVLVAALLVVGTLAAAAGPARAALMQAQAVGTPGGPPAHDLRPCRQRGSHTMLIVKEREPDDERT